MHNGNIIKTGDFTLAKKLELTGYSWLDKNNSL
jgi:Fe-S cluster assembly ATPase SufC